MVFWKSKHKSSITSLSSKIRANSSNSQEHESNESSKPSKHQLSSTQPNANVNTNTNVPKPHIKAFRRETVPETFMSSSNPSSANYDLSSSRDSNLHTNNNTNNTSLNLNFNSHEKSALESTQNNSAPLANPGGHPYSLPSPPTPSFASRSTASLSTTNLQSPSTSSLITFPVNPAVSSSNSSYRSGSSLSTRFKKFSFKPSPSAPVTGLGSSVFGSKFDPDYDTFLGDVTLSDDDNDQLELVNVHTGVASIAGVSIASSTWTIPRDESRCTLNQALHSQQQQNQPRNSTKISTKQNEHLSSSVPIPPQAPKHQILPKSDSSAGGPNVSRPAVVVVVEQNDQLNRDSSSQRAHNTKFRSADLVQKQQLHEPLLPIPAPPPPEPFPTPKHNTNNTTRTINTATSSQPVPDLVYKPLLKAPPKLLDDDSTSFVSKKSLKSVKSFRTNITMSNHSISSPSPSLIFERSVQDLTAPDMYCQKIPSHYACDDCIPPVLTASTEVLQNSEIDPEHVVVVQSSLKRPSSTRSLSQGIKTPTYPRSFSVSSANSDGKNFSLINANNNNNNNANNIDKIFSNDSRSPSTSSAVSDLSPSFKSTPLRHSSNSPVASTSFHDQASPSSSRNNSNNGKQNDVKVLSFYSFADLVSTEHVAAAGGDINGVGTGNTALNSPNNILHHPFGSPSSSFSGGYCSQYPVSPGSQSPKRLDKVTSFASLNQPHNNTHTPHSPLHNSHPHFNHQQHAKLTDPRLSPSSPGTNTTTGATYSNSGSYFSEKPGFQSTPAHANYSTTTPSSPGHYNSKQAADNDYKSGQVSPCFVSDGSTNAPASPSSPGLSNHDMNSNGNSKPDNYSCNNEFHFVDSTRSWRHEEGAKETGLDMILERSQNNNASSDAATGFLNPASPEQYNKHFSINTITSSSTAGTTSNTNTESSSSAASTSSSSSSNGYNNSSNGNGVGNKPSSPSMLSAPLQLNDQNYQHVSIANNNLNIIPNSNGFNGNSVNGNPDFVTISGSVSGGIDQTDYGAQFTSLSETLRRTKDDIRFGGSNGNSGSMHSRSFSGSLSGDEGLFGDESRQGKELLAASPRNIVNNGVGGDEHTQIHKAGSLSESQTSITPTVSSASLCNNGQHQGSNMSNVSNVSNVSDSLTRNTTGMSIGQDGDVEMSTSQQLKNGIYTNNNNNNNCQMVSNNVS